MNPIDMAMILPGHMPRHGMYGAAPPMPYPPGLLGPGIGMPMPMHPAMAGVDPFGLTATGLMGHPALSSVGMGGMGMGMSGLHPGMLGGMRSRHSPYYHQTQSYGYGRNGARYLDPYDLFDDIFEGDAYVDDYDDIDDPLLAWMRMARGGGGGRRGRRGRYGRYGGLGYHGF